MQAIEWKLNYEFIKFEVEDAHLILLLLEITILHTRHLVKILKKKTSHWQGNILSIMFASS
jgi:hypothetical protein